MMMILLMLPLLFGNFVQKWFIPRGMMGEGGRLLISDADRDGNYEFYITPSGGTLKIYIYELHLPDTWEVDSFPYFGTPLVWDIGDFDLDGLYDLAIQTAVGPPLAVLFSVAESPDSFSYPTQEVWRDTVGPALVTPICAYDIDQDGLPEIVKVQGDYSNFYIYESVGDNLYAQVFIDTLPQWGPLSTIAFGDFDADNHNEFVAGDDCYYGIYECVGDNLYQQILVQLLQTNNIKDCFSIPDADGDGKLEFVVKGFGPSTGIIKAFIFEATGDNTYDIIQSFVLQGGAYYGGYSEAGDVDGDSVPEIVLEARQNVFIIKAACNDSFYVWETLPGNNSGSSVRVLDLDNNGLAEVIISGNNQTRIYEYEVGIEDRPQVQISARTIEVKPSPFTDVLQIRFQSRVGDAVDVSIYDVSGRLVKRLHEGALGGDQTIIWHGQDDNCRKVAPGTYFIRVDNLASGDILYQKVLRVK
jgi:hypothetical protein